MVGATSFPERNFQRMAVEDEADRPGNGITREEARALEEDFLGRFRGKLAVLREIFNPMDGRVYFVDPTQRAREWDEGEKVKRIMMEEGVLDRAIRRRMPVNRALRLDIGTKGILTGFSPAAAVAAISLSPVRDLAVKGRSEAEVTFYDVEDAVKRAAHRGRIFHYVGVYATTSFAEECLKQPPRSKNYFTILVSRGNDTAWRVLNGEDFPWPGARDIFDLELTSEKLNRCRRAMLEHPDLRLKGGHVPLEDLRRELGFADELFERALGEVLEEEAFQVREVGGIRILQRPRFS